MAQVTEAIFTRGVLKPVGKLSLRESQRVRITVEPLDASVAGFGDREIELPILRSKHPGTLDLSQFDFDDLLT
jgi:predicted DNA-binding antitoxin AbrB/MazE fold protein